MNAFKEIYISFFFGLPYDRIIYIRVLEFSFKELLLRK